MLRRNSEGGNMKWPWQSGERCSKCNGKGWYAEDSSGWGRADKYVCEQCDGTGDMSKVNKWVPPTEEEKCLRCDGKGAYGYVDDRGYVSAVTCEKCNGTGRR